MSSDKRPYLYKYSVEVKHRCRCCNRLLGFQVSIQNPDEVCSYCKFNLQQDSYMKGNRKIEQ